MNKDFFSSYHPAVLFVYFLMTAGFSVVFLHPGLLTVSLAGALAYAACLKRAKLIGFFLKFLLPLFLLSSLFNPIFNHAGSTILAYFRNGNPLTLESCVYGLAAAVMITSVITWFSCYNEVMTSDKFIYLFGRVAPSLSLVFSMVLRFVPRFAARLKAVSKAQAGVGKDIRTGGAAERIKHGVSILSVMVTWALESAVDTADSMNGRGYGLPSRTAFAVYRFGKRDLPVSVFFLFCGVYITVGAVAGELSVKYFPATVFPASSLYGFSVLACYAALCLTPTAINIFEAGKWRALKSKI